MPTKTIIQKNRGISYIKRIFGASHAPVFVSLFFTRKCNLNCRYCKASKVNNGSDISIEKWKIIIDQLHNLGCRHITIYGGEPTLRPDLPELLKHCTKKGIMTHIVSNGTLIDEDLLQELIRYGYFILGISVDNFEVSKPTEKIYRPELIELLREIKTKYPNYIDICFNIIINRENFKNIVDLIKKLSEHIVCEFSLDPVHSSQSPNQAYSYRNFCPDLKLRSQEMCRFRDLIFKLKKCNIVIWGTKRYYYFYNKWYNNKYKWNCDAGDLYYSINNDGKIMLCEEITTNLNFSDFVKLPYKKRIKRIRKFKPCYCNCFKPCYWIPSDLVKHPIQNYLYRYRFTKVAMD